jgi:hypothetical protein
MDPSSAEARARLRQAIDDGIKEFQELIRALEEVTQASKCRRNALVPISRLPPETLAEIFSFLSPPACDDGAYGYRSWLYITHVCHQWREIAIHCPHLWSHVSASQLGTALLTEILTRTKMAPLHLEMAGYYTRKWDDFERILKAHISHTRHLRIAGDFHAVLRRLTSSAPALEFLFLSNSHGAFVIPDTLFNGTTPRLTGLKLYGCDISWKSPLLRGLQTLEILNPSLAVVARSTLEDWLDALNGMPQLQTLTLETPIFHDSDVPTDSVDLLISEPQRIITLPSLTKLSIHALAMDCVLAFAHLVFPALTSLHVHAESSWEDGDGEDVQLLIPHVARNSHGSQDSMPLQSILLDGGQTTHVEMVTWTAPDAALGVCDLITFNHAADSARVHFFAKGLWNYGTDTVIIDSLLTHLPVHSISTLTAENDTQLSKEVWLCHAPRLAMLKRVRLACSAVGSFRRMLAEDAALDRPARLPLLTTLILFEVSLTVRRTYRLRHTLIKRMKQGAPLENLDLRTCDAAERAVQFLAEIVGNVQGPARPLKVGNPAFFDWEGGVGSPGEEDGSTDDDEF